MGADMSGEMKISAGWKLVPEVLTDAMRDAVVQFSEKAVNAHQIHELTWDNYYAVMTRASPPPPEDGWKPIEGAHSSKQRTRNHRFVPSPDGRTIDDDDFLYDASLTVSGDFADDESRHSFAQWLCEKLNASPSPPPAALEPKEQHD
jgi:hypothetical protein